MVAHFVTDFEGHPAVIARPLIANGNGTISSYHVLLMEKWLINGLAMMARNQGSVTACSKNKYRCTTLLFITGVRIVNNYRCTAVNFYLFLFIFVCQNSLPVFPVMYFFSLAAKRPKFFSSLQLFDWIFWFQGRLT